MFGFILYHMKIKMTDVGQLPMPIGWLGQQTAPGGRHGNCAYHLLSISAFQVRFSARCFLYALYALYVTKSFFCSLISMLIVFLNFEDRGGDY